MFDRFQPFGHEVHLLNTTITTATQKTFNLKNNRFVKMVIRLIGLPHFGARLRAYHLNKLLNALPPRQKILDAGCGMGLNSFLAVRKNHRVVGIDMDTEKIGLANTMSIAKGYQSASFRKDDLTRLSLKNNSFDTVMCFEVLEHIAQDRKAVSEISRVLKPGGVLLLSVPGQGVISRINQESKHHVREGYSIKGLTQLLESNKLTIQKRIAIEHTPVGFFVRYVNDEIGRRSLPVVTVFFPVFLTLGIIDSFLPEGIAPNNWIVVAKKEQRYLF